MVFGDLKIELIQTAFYGFVPVDGNHKLARLTQILGENTIVAVAMSSGVARLPQTLIQPTYLDIKVEQVRGFGIRSYADFIAACVNEQFEKFEPFSQGNEAILIA